MLIIVGGLIAFALAGSGLTLGLWRRGRGEKQAYLRDTRRDAIGQLPGGTVARVQGAVVPVRDLLASPLTGRTCVSYAVLVHADDASGPVIAKVQAGIRFAVHDASGRALIEMDGVNITLTADHTEVVAITREFSPAQRDVLLRNQLPPVSPRPRPRVLVFIEAVLRPGTLIDVSGVAAREPDPDSTRESAYREVAPTRVTFHSTSTPDADADADADE